MKTVAVIGGVVGGLFVGALVVELLARRRSTSALTGVRKRATSAIGAISTGFREGYRASVERSAG